MVVETGKFLTAGRNDFSESCFSEPCTVFTEWWVFSLFLPKSHGTVKWDMVRYGQDITGEILDGFQRLLFFTIRYICSTLKRRVFTEPTMKFYGGFFDMNVRNEIKAQIVRAGMTMQEVVDLLHDEYGWSDSVSNLSAKLQRESIRYKEVLELADVLGYDIVWQKGREK